MAARRLIIVLLVLFAVSIVAALIAPERRGPLLGDDSSSSSDSTSSTTSEKTTTEPATTEKTTPDELPSGESLTLRIDASAAKPGRAEASVGDQLELNVASGRAREIEIPAFGVTEDAEPGVPANFNLLLREAGRLPILDADSGELLGRLDVAKPKPRKGRRAGKSGGANN